MDSAENLAPVEAAAEAVKAYLRLHRARIADDSELLALLLPGRFGSESNVTDYQKFLIVRQAEEIAALKAEREGLRRHSDRAGVTREGVRRLVLDLVGARSFEEVVSVARGAARFLGAEMVSLGIESEIDFNFGTTRLYALPPGIADKLIERDAAGALLKGNAYAALFPGVELLQSVAVFRLRFGPKTPPALYAVGSRDAGRFDEEAETREIAYFARALERAIRTWLTPRKS